MRPSFAFTALLFGFLALFVAACSQEPPEPVARLTVTPETVQLSFPQTATLLFAWSPLVQRDILGSHPTVFVHLIDAEGEVLRTFDHELDVSAWTVGEDLTYELELYQSYLASALEVGSYRLTAGLYEPEGERYGVLSDNLEVGRQEFVVAEVRVPELQETTLSVEFLGDWMAVAAGSDRQVLAHRWLGDGGTLRVEPVTQPIRLTLRLNLVAATDGSQLAGSGALRVSLRSSCGPSTEISQRGTYRVDLHLDPPDEGHLCEIELEPESVWTDRGDGSRRSLRLEGLTLSPAERE